MNNSYWLDLQEGKHYPPLCDDKHVHTLIIGAGLSGLTTAYYLAQNIDVMIIEADEIGYGSSGRNTGKITFQHGLLYHKLMKDHGIEKAKDYYLAQKEAIASIQAIVQEHQISCRFENKSALLYTSDETKIADIDAEYEAYQTLGIDAQYVHTSTYPFPIVAGIKVENQAGYDPYAYLLGLSDCLDALGVKIYEHSTAQSIIKDGSGWQVTVNEHTIYAQNIVCATMTPLLDAFTFFYAKTYPSLSHLALINTYQECQKEMLYAIDDPLVSYHGINHALMLCGGYEHLCGEASQIDQNAWLSVMRKTWNCDEVKMVWNTQDLMSYDHLPLIGSLSKHNKNFYIACGFSKWGNTNANVAAKIICSLILKQEHAYAYLFEPSRINPFFTKTCFHMNMHTAMTFLKSQFPDFAEPTCKACEGKVIELDHRPYGMYCDEQSELYIVDIRCPHMGCICSFNDIDHTWDCPCHGSRFTYDGKIIKGPAQSPLSSYESETNNHVDPHEFVVKKQE